jgi:hypothetical protein
MFLVPLVVEQIYELNLLAPDSDISLRWFLVLTIGLCNITTPFGLFSF